MAHIITRKIISVATAMALSSYVAVPAFANDATAADDQSNDGKLPLHAQATDDSTAAPQTKEEAAALLDDANQKASEAQAAEQAARVNLTGAQSAVEQAEADASAAQQAADDARAAAEQGIADAVSAAKQAEADAQAVLDAATGNTELSLDEARAAVETTSAAVDKAKTSLVGSVTNADPKYDAEATEKKLADAQSAVDKAQKTSDAAHKAYDDASGAGETNPEIAEAKAKMDAAEQAASEAEAAQVAADDALSKAQSNATAAQEAAANAKSEAEAATAAEQQAQTSAASAKTAAEEATSARAAAESTVAEKNTAVSDAQAKLESAKTAASSAQAKKDSADKTVSDKTAELDGLKAELEALKSSGVCTLTNSRDFFLKYGSSDAITALDKAYYSSSTDTSAAYDATNIDNMLKTMQFLRECNAIRAELNLGELKVTDTLMAIAQSNLNWSDSNFDHSRQFNVGENLAWGQRSDAYAFDWDTADSMSNPFEGWFDEERLTYLEAVEQNPDIASMSSYELSNVPWTDDYGNSTNLYSCVGHYLNVINPDYQYTGFAFSGDPANNYQARAYGQVFSYSAATQQYNRSGMFSSFTNTSAETAYTVDEYEARLKAAIANETTSPDTSELDQKIANAETALAEAQSAADAAAQELATANQAVTAAQSAADAAQAAADEAAQTLANAKTAEENALAYADAQQSAASEAATKSAAASTALEAANKALEDANSQLATAQADAADKASAAAAAKQAYADAKAAYESLLPNLTELGQAVEAADADLAAKKAALDELSKQAAVDKARSELVAAALAELNSETAPTTLTNVEKLAKEDDAVKAALESYTSAVTQYNDAVIALKAAEAAAGTTLTPEEAQDALAKAQDKRQRAEQLTYTENTADEDFAYLNELFEAAREAEAKAADASKALAEAQTAEAAASERYESLHQAYVEALADLAVAQAAYDAFVEGEGGSGEEQGQKAANPATITKTTKTVKAKAVAKAAKKVKCITVTNAQGEVTYKKKAGSSYLKANKKSGKIVVAKGTPAGTYTIKVKVKVAGNDEYEALTKVVKVKVKVK